MTKDNIEFVHWFVKEEFEDTKRVIMCYILNTYIALEILFV